MKRAAFRWVAGIVSAGIVGALGYTIGNGFQITPEPVLFAAAAVVLLGIGILLATMRPPDEPRWDDLAMRRRTSDRSLDTPGVAPYIAPDESSRRRLSATLKTIIDDKVRSAYGFDPATNPERARAAMPPRVHEFRFDEDPVRRLVKTSYVERLVTEIERTGTERTYLQSSEHTAPNQGQGTE
ncbi:hypothetical protein CLV47_102146 [Antricoccus suffuscus]|uniref:Uncharacterized protein n=1 Tax=Antricoccus suffuscus TaxID=1629062 RepID=A0A2T1A4D3_9ACTN|nr:hypothetical protein [Antricoccus suffuscus]PRZ43460.1 hypothetical protein CLV47_102146 [Antricoccus suffuscus]